MIERSLSEGRTMQLIDRLLAFKLPLIGEKPVNQQVQVLLILLGLGFVVLLAVLMRRQPHGANGTLQTEIVGDALMHTQRLAKAGRTRRGQPRRVHGTARQS